MGAVCGTGVAYRNEDSFANRDQRRVSKSNLASRIGESSDLRTTLIIEQNNRATVDLPQIKLTNRVTADLPQIKLTMLAY